MRIRLPFAIAFFILLLLSSSAGLLPHSSLPTSPIPTPRHSDKALHFITFFALSATFHFIFDAARRRVLHLTLFVCTLCLGVGTEFLQAWLPNDREFDAWDVLANVLGSLCAIGLAQAYHKRSTERRRKAKYAALTDGAATGDDLELGQALPDAAPTDHANGDLEHPQEIGVVSTLPPQPHPKSVEEELDNWDEHAPDDAWDEANDEGSTLGGGPTKGTPATGSEASEDVHLLQKKVTVD